MKCFQLLGWPEELFVYILLHFSHQGYCTVSIFYDIFAYIAIKMHKSKVHLTYNTVGTDGKNKKINSLSLLLLKIYLDYFFDLVL